VLKDEVVQVHVLVVDPFAADGEQHVVNRLHDVSSIRLLPRRSVNWCSRPRPARRCATSQRGVQTLSNGVSGYVQASGSSGVVPSSS